MGRRTPYSAIGISRLKCFRHGCKNRAVFQWNICSDGNVFRPICISCDIALNRTVLEFMGFPDAKQKGDVYEALKRAEYGEDRPYPRLYANIRFRNTQIIDVQIVSDAAPSPQ